MTDSDTNKLTKAESRLPTAILRKAIISGNEFGWKPKDFIEVVQAANECSMALIGGQVQYVFEDGTCELDWLSYDPEQRQPNENWSTYCNRTAKECVDKFNKLIAATDVEKEALKSFEFLKGKHQSGIDISSFLAFILYFDDSETDLP